MLVAGSDLHAASLGEVLPEHHKTFTGREQGNHVGAVQGSLLAGLPFWQWMISPTFVHDRQLQIKVNETSTEHLDIF